MSDTDLLAKAPQLGQELMGRAMECDLPAIRDMICGKASPYVVRRMIQKYQAMGAPTLGE